MVAVVSSRPISPAQSFAPRAARAWATASYSFSAVTSSACSVWFRSWMNDGAAFERHESNLTYSLFVRLSKETWFGYRHNKIKMVQRNRIIRVQRNSINTAQRNQIMETRTPKEAGYGHTA